MADFTEPRTAGLDEVRIVEAAAAMSAVATPISGSVAVVAGDGDEGQGAMRDSKTKHSREAFTLGSDPATRHHGLQLPHSTVRQPCFLDRLVMDDKSKFRWFWELLISFLLIYIGTIFLYRLCFVEFHIEIPDGTGVALENATAETEPASMSFQVVDGWDLIDLSLQVVFGIDLFFNFFFTYRNAWRQEVRDFPSCAKKYLYRGFVINLIACMPAQAMKLVFNSTSGDPEINSVVRIARLQRMSRMARLVHLTQLAKLTSQGERTCEWLDKNRGVRVVNLAVGLFWIVHILACGWYLIAALQEDPNETWVARRTVDTAGEISLLTRDSFEQWVHSVYFVITVFTTVGFGDMSGQTISEMIYVCFLMMAGVVLHSMIISEVITALSTSDKLSQYVKKNVDLVDDFADHAQLGDSCREDLHTWIYMNSHAWISEQYSKKDLKELIVGKYMPRELLDSIPSALFGGNLVRNRLLTCCDGICHTPPRLFMVLAMALTKVDFKKGDIIYRVQDYPFNAFLVLKGLFAYVIRPVHAGRKSVQLREDEPEVSYVLFPYGSYFGETEIFHECSRRATVRCESEVGSLLSLNRVELKQLVAEFPEFSAMWLRNAGKHERKRLKRLHEMAPGKTALDVAVLVLQSFVRSPAWKHLQVRRDNKMRKTTVLAVEAARGDGARTGVGMGSIGAASSHEGGGGLRQGGGPSVLELSGKLDALVAKVAGIDVLNERVNLILEVLTRERVVAADADGEHCVRV